MIACGCLLPYRYRGSLMRLSPVAAILIVCPFSFVARADDTPKPVVKMTAQEDHKRMMELLKIGELRRGADGNPKSERAANLDESKANPYPDLPDPLLMKDGTKVNAALWPKRRTEIVEDFDREVYGRVPKDTPFF